MSRQTLFRPLAAFAVLVLAVAAFGIPHVPTSEAATTRVLAITNASGPKVPFSAFDGNPPKVFDINGDGKLEIIAQNDNQYVYVFDSKTGKLLFEAKTTFPTSWGARSFNGPEVAVMQNGGSVRLIVANSAAFITSYRFDLGASTSTSFKFVKEWEKRLTECHSNPGMDSKPVFADLDKDGVLEILAGTEERGLYAIRNNGVKYWTNCLGGGNAEPTVADINLDSWPDVVHVSDAGIVAALNGRTGGWMWSFNVHSKFNLGSGSIPVGAAVGQLIAGGTPEIVFGARDSHDATNWDNDHAVLFALSGGGGFLWGFRDPIGNPLTYTHPIIVDAAKDGQAEVYWGDWNTVGHKPPFDDDAWMQTGPAHFYRIDNAGRMVWRQTLDTFWSNKDLAIADVDGDGVQEVLANGPASSGHDGIWYLDTRTGAKETFVDTHPWKVQRQPIVADLWNTGTMQWIVAGSPMTSSAGGPAILVYDTGQRFNAAWPHLPYVSFDRGTTTTPPPPTTTTSPPPPTGSFAATFNIKAPNEWWQEVDLDPDTPRTITSMQVRINGGSWQAMTLRSWGHWASSYNSKAGSQVEFLARDSNDAVSQSLPFTWMDGTLSKRSTGSITTTPPPPTTTTPPPPTTTTPPGGLDARFSVPDTVNEWWVEVRVDSANSIAGVDARVNGGSWTPLELRSWGNWAKSFFVARGSAVEFRATDANGAQVVSQTFQWLSAGGFATFTPKAVGNDWWVEVQVTTSAPLTKVEASVNNGAWIALELKTWGNWAKSIHAPDGSKVTFRATNDQGATQMSATYTWT